MNPAPQSHQSPQVLLVAGGWGAHQRGSGAFPPFRWSAVGHRSL